MTYIKILEPGEETTKILKNIISSGKVNDISVNEKECDEKTELLCAAKLENEVDLENYTNLKIIIAGIKDAAQIKNMPPVQIITCGWEEKDTFTYSSVNEDEVIFSLQRKITSLRGDIIQPCEIKVSREKYNFGKREDEEALFAFCICQCLGNGNNSH